MVRGTIRRLCAALLFLAGLTHAAGAQNLPYGKAAAEAPGTIAATGVWQQVWGASQNGVRTNCVIQNTGTHAMSVFFGPTAPAPNATVGFPLGPATASGSFNVGGGVISCGNIGGGLTSGPVWITGTQNDTFEYASQP